MRDNRGPVYRLNNLKNIVSVTCAHMGGVGNGSFRPRVVSALSRFGPGSFQPGSFRPWVISAQFGGSFRPIFSSTIRLVTEGQLNTFLAIWRVHGSW